MSAYLAVVLLLQAVRYALHVVVELLNLRHISPELPAEFKDVFDADRYRQAQAYLRDTTRFGLGVETLFTAFAIAFLLAGGFDAVDRLVRATGQSPLVTGLLFCALLGLGRFLLRIPFTAHRTFVIEQRYGFNRTTWPTFWLDHLKALILGGIIGGVALTAVLWCFARLGALAWLYAWLAVTAFELFVVFVSPVVILPLFNRFTPLEAGPLRTAIEDYARAQRFRIRDIFTMDGSRRSAKSNAFFTGFGRFRRIALFDTLIARHTLPEILAVLAHEVGHNKGRHVLKHVLLEVAVNGILFYLLSLLIYSPAFAHGLGLTRHSLYANLVLFTYLYKPLATLLHVLACFFTRRHEYAADAFAARTLGTAEPMITALKKLSRDNLSNLTPHPLKVWFSYTHPPVLERIRALSTMPSIPSVQPASDTPRA